MAISDFSPLNSNSSGYSRGSSALSTSSNRLSRLLVSISLYLLIRVTVLVPMLLLSHSPSSNRLFAVAFTRRTTLLAASSSSFSSSHHYISTTSASSSAGSSTISSTSSGLYGYQRGYIGRMPTRFGLLGATRLLSKDVKSSSRKSTSASTSATASTSTTSASSNLATTRSSTSRRRGSVVAPLTSSCGMDYDDGCSGQQQQMSSTATTTTGDDGADTSTTTNSSNSEMDLVFVGTASCTPTESRGVSCVALRYNNEVWLFDCGEATQQRLARSSVRATWIKKIFITHLHGDHIFGLPAVLCYAGQAYYSQGLPPEPIDIYGPEGLRDFIRATIHLSESNIVPPFRVHEIKDIPTASSNSASSSSSRSTSSSYHNNKRHSQGSGHKLIRTSPIAKERSGERDIYPNDDMTYTLVRASHDTLIKSLTRGDADADAKLLARLNTKTSGSSSSSTSVDGSSNSNAGSEGGMKLDDAAAIDDRGVLSVTAAPLNHTIPCVGYVIKELDRLGQLRVDRLSDIVERNKDALPAMLGARTYKKVYMHLKALSGDATFTFPDGTVVSAADCLDPPRKGRKVVIMGDTCNSDRIVHIAMDSDVLIHEATNSWIPEIETVTALSRIRNYKALERETISHGHSTSDMAGAFAARIRARHLLLTHFSSKYPGDDTASSNFIMRRIERLAEDAAKRTATSLNDTYFGTSSGTSATSRTTTTTSTTSNSNGQDNSSLLHKKTPSTTTTSSTKSKQQHLHSAPYIPPIAIAQHLALASSSPYFTPQVTAAHDTLVVPVPIEARNLAVTRPSTKRGGGERGSDGEGGEVKSTGSGELINSSSSETSTSSTDATAASTSTTTTSTINGKSKRSSRLVKAAESAMNTIHNTDSTSSKRGVK